MAIGAGKFNAYIEIQEQTLVPDGGGGHIKTWEPVGNLWAQWKHQTMWERLNAMQLQSGVRHRVWVRYNEFITPLHRVVYRGKAFNILGVVNIEELNEDLELQLEEGVAI